MAGSVPERARTGNHHVAAPSRAYTPSPAPERGHPDPAGGLLRPSQVPAAGESVMRIGALSTLVVQRRPEELPKAEGGEHNWRDANYPKLKMRRERFDEDTGISTYETSSGKILYYGAEVNGEYFDDPGCQTVADMWKYGEGPAGTFRVVAGVEYMLVPIEQFAKAQGREKIVATRLDGIIASMEKGIVFRPIAAEVSEEGSKITDGNHRLAAARKLGYTQIPVRK